METSRDQSRSEIELKHYTYEQTRVVKDEY